MSKEYNEICYLKNHVNGLPIMTRITKDGLLALRGYKINKGQSEALAIFLARNDDEFSPYRVKSLILDDNGMSDDDFASLINSCSK